MSHILLRHFKFTVRCNYFLNIRCSLYANEKIMDTSKGLFEGVSDRFNGITIDSSLYVKEENFLDKLEKSLISWKDKNVRVIWFKIYLEKADWVPILAKKQFNFHHAKNNYVMMYKWLSPNEFDNVPQFAHTLIGVGGLVVNSNNEVLVVSEKHPVIPGSWKLPGGYVEPSENLIDAVVREVQEETGIKTKFETLISIVHSHSGSFGCSNIYIVTGLTLQNDDDVQIKLCEQEIAQVQWMPISEYLQHPNVHDLNRKFLKTYQMYKKKGIKINCEENIHQILKKKYNLYAVEMN